MLLRMLCGRQQSEGASIVAVVGVSWLMTSGIQLSKNAMKERVDENPLSPYNHFVHMHIRCYHATSQKRAKVSVSF